MRRRSHRPERGPSPNCTAFEQAVRSSDVAEGNTSRQITTPVNLASVGTRPGPFRTDAHWKESNGRAECHL